MNIIPIPESMTKKSGRIKMKRRVGCGICQRGMREAVSILIGSRGFMTAQQGMRRRKEGIHTEDQLRAALIRPGDPVIV